MKRVTLTLLAIMLAAPVFAGGTVRLREYTEVTTRYVRLRQVAEFEASSRETERKLEKVFLGSIEKDQESLLLNRRQVLEKLRGYGVKVNEVRLVGASYVCVRKIDSQGRPQLTRANMQPVEQNKNEAEDNTQGIRLRIVKKAEKTPEIKTSLNQEITNRIRDAYENQYPKNGFRFRLIGKTVPDNLSGRVVKISRLLQFDQNDNLLCGRFRLTLQDGSEKVIRPVVEIEKPEKIVVAKKSLRPGEKITERHLTTREKKHGETGLDPEKIIGKRLGRRIAAGSPVRSKDIRKEPVIREGDIVKIKFKNRLYVIEKNAMQALSDGAPGDVIQVATPVKRRHRRNQQRENVTFVRVIKQGLVQAIESRESE